ncbi:MAG TPA: hypothetical protein VN541_00805 [Tepidisphaeraceae bacterium]|nr:hypothetical protein [Tepidisphaeraceae bacterium]
MIRLWCVQILGVLRLEVRKTFLARRGLWIYLLALAPVLLFAGQSIYAPRRQARLARIAREHPVSRWALLFTRPGVTREDVEKRLGEPYFKQTQIRWFRGTRVRRDVYRYTDGQTDEALVFFDGKLVRIFRSNPRTLADDNTIFATIFQFYYLRLAVFFGCVGVFTNLFRGEMVDKSLHFYLLTPMRREVLLAGKFLAGLIATVVIFSCGTALQLGAMLWQFRGPALTDYLHGPGWGDVAAYLGVTGLACCAYGSVFLAAGLLWSNPIVPAAVVLIWESANVFVPAALKKLSMIYYLQAMCPVVAEPESDMSLPLRLLLSATEPPGVRVALVGIVALIIAVLLIAAVRARKLEINYSTD